MKLEFTGTYNINTDAERKRINKCFKGEILKRQLHLLDLFESGKFQDWCEAFNKLPYDEEVGCSEKEYVGLYSDTIRELFQYSKFTLENFKILKS